MLSRRPSLVVVLVAEMRLVVRRSPSDSGTSERWPITRSGSENARFAVPPYRSIGASARSAASRGFPAGTCRCTTTHGVSVVAVDARLTAMTPNTESATRRPPTMARVLGRFGAEMTGLAWPESGRGVCEPLACSFEESATTTSTFLGNWPCRPTWRQGDGTDCSDRNKG